MYRIYMALFSHYKVIDMAHVSQGYIIVILEIFFPANVLPYY